MDHESISGTGLKIYQQLSHLKPGESITYRDARVIVDLDSLKIKSPYGEYTLKLNISESVPVVDYETLSAPEGLNVSMMYFRDYLEKLNERLDELTSTEED